MLKKIVAIMLVLAMVFSLAACGKTGETQPQSGGAENNAGGEEQKEEVPLTPAGKTDLKFALDQEPASLDPYMHTKQQGFTVGTLIFETLIKKDENGKFIPWLATEWELVDDTTIVFKLRDDVTFHDGSKMTAEDVVYSLALGATSSFSKTVFSSIDPENTKALDEYTVELKLLNPYAPLFEALASFRGAILCKAARESMGETEYGRAPVGTGPMKFVQWVSGDRIDLEAYDGYWGEKLPFETATARIIVESSSRSIELETGGVDIAMELAFSDWDRIDSNPDTVLISGESQSSTFILLNNSMKPFDDIRVRQALAYAIDMQSLVDIAFQGNAVVADSYYIPSILGHKSVGPMEYNPEKAKSLLAEAGYGDGVEIDFYTYEHPIHSVVGEVLQSMWGAVGVKVNILVVDLATQTELNNTGKVSTAHMSPTVAIADPDAALMIWPTWRTISIRHNDQHVQDLLDAGRSTYDDEERAKIYGELQDYLFSKTYSIPVAFPKAAFGTRNYIEGLEFSPSLVPDMTTIRFK
jgi:peptide/nickel transport system substrate-binding protein